MVNLLDSKDTSGRGTTVLENLPRDVLDNIFVGCQVIGSDFRYLYVNEAAARQGSTNRERLLGQSMLEAYPGIEKTAMFASLRRCLDERTPQQMENEFAFPDGSTSWFELRFEPLPDGVLILSLEITARKRAEAASRRSKRALATLSECNQTLVRANDEQQFMQDVCRIVVGHGGYRMAWIGLKEDDPERSIRPVARAGHDDGYVDRARLTWDDTERGRGPTGRAIRTGQACVTRFIDTEPRFEPWRENALERGFASSIALPIRDNGAIIGALMVYAAEPDAFDDDEMLLLEELATDIGFGLTTLRSNATRRRAQARVEHLNAVLRGLRSVGRLIAQERDPHVFIQKACERLVESRGFYTARIVLCQDGQAKQVATAGGEPRLSSPNTIIGRGDLPEYLRHVIDGLDVVVRPNPIQSCSGYPADESYPVEMHSVAIGIEHEGVVYGALLVYFPSGMAADEEEISLLREMAWDMAFALWTMKIEDERFRAQEELRLSAARWSATFDAISDIVCVLSRDHEFLVINKAGSDAMGLPKQKVVGRKCFELIHHTSAPIAACPCEQSTRTLEPASSVHEQDGRTYELTAWPILGADRSLEAFVHIVKDLTDVTQMAEALRVSEKKYRGLVEDLDDVVFALNTEGRFEFVSSAIRSLGYLPEELHGRDFFGLVHPDDRTTVEESFRRTLAGAARFCEFRLLDDKARVHFIRMSSRKVEDAEGDQSVRGVLVDLTEQRRTEEQLMLSQRLEAVGRLAGGVAHDFNNLLSVVISYADFALEALHENDPIRVDIEEIQKAGQRAAALTRQLLAFSRRQVLAPEVLSLNRVVGGIESMLRRLLGEDIEIAVHLADELGSVEADPGQIEQVIMNLAVNARDAMSRGGKLTIETENTELDEAYAVQHVAVTPGRYVLLTVSDTGNGMDAETRAHIFDPFFTTKGKGKGTGLGLATVYGIVKQSGGNIWVYSEPGHGTTFKVYLPRVDVEPTEARRRPDPVMVRGSETVLVVEDEDAVRKLAERILRSAGYRVMTAANGGEAFLLCEQHPGEIDLLLTDVVMPQMSGKQLADRLAGIRPDMKVVYMSGYTDNAIVHHGVLDPGTRLISKPFSAAELARKVREVLDEYEAGGTR